MAPVLTAPAVAPGDVSGQRARPHRSRGGPRLRSRPQPGSGGRAIRPLPVRHLTNPRPGTTDKSDLYMRLR
ncbi:hypothetical protein BL254_21595 [Protofrankia sp. BMG5.30]|uniref:Uncharacterized protein n=1 Tax=Protofrankia coriariae TaxID=1562887 RepID=A0ABR5EZ21_9ACTN|nr:hypothetical protein FrCorBMG51_23050 [Protofrankia coriariae]ONH32556.1 hypothetical protein BL254_21595 [Protofrankia sp. BMG5.30]